MNLVIEEAYGKFIQHVFLTAVWMTIQSRRQYLPVAVRLHETLILATKLDVIFQ